MQAMYGEPKMRLRELFDWLVICLFALLPLAAVIIFITGMMCLIAPPACSMEKLATISPNPFIGDSTSNPFSMWNNPFNANSPYNQFGPYGNQFSPYSANNEFATQTPGIYGYADEAYGGDYSSDGSMSEY